MRPGAGSHRHDHEPHAVYRVLGRYGRVIYIGVSHDPAARVDAHQATAAWRAEIITWEVVGWHQNLAAARPAERAAIKAEDPDYNFQHTDDALLVARTPMCDRPRVNAEVRAARATRVATARLHAAIRHAA